MVTVPLLLFICCGFGSQTLGPLPLRLTQPVIIRQQSLGQDGFAPLGHLLCHIGHRSGTAIAESRRYTEHTRDIAIFIIAQSCAITNKKQRLFAIFYKLGQVGNGAGYQMSYAGVQASTTEDANGDGGSAEIKTYYEDCVSLVSGKIALGSVSKPVFKYSQKTTTATGAIRVFVIKADGSRETLATENLSGYADGGKWAARSYDLSAYKDQKWIRLGIAFDQAKAAVLIGDDRILECRLVLVASDGIYLLDKPVGYFVLG